MFTSIPSTQKPDLQNDQKSIPPVNTGLDEMIVIPNEVANKEKLASANIKVIRPCGDYFLQVRVPDIPAAMVSYVAGTFVSSNFVGQRVAVSNKRIIVVIDDSITSPHVRFVWRGKDEPPDNIFRLSRKDFDAAKACLPSPQVLSPP